MPKTAIAYLAGIGSLMAMLCVGFTAGLVLTGSGLEKIGPTRLDRVRSPARTASIDPSSLRSIPQPIEVETTEMDDAKAKAQGVTQSASNNPSTASIDTKIVAAVPKVQSDLNGASTSTSIATNASSNTKTDTINSPSSQSLQFRASAIGITDTSSKSGVFIKPTAHPADNLPLPRTQKTNRLEKMILRTIELPDGRHITQLLPFTRKREAKLTTN